MNENLMFFIYLFSMAAVTYLVRMLPLVFFKKKIKNRFLRSFLYYIPYVVLTVMTFPGIFYSTSSVYSALAGCIAAIALAYFKRSLVTVAIGSVITVYISELIISFI